jgi:hypothetical protein
MTIFKRKTAISTAMAVRMLESAGMGENVILDAFANLSPVATMDDVKYWCPRAVSRAIKRLAVQ